MTPMMQQYFEIKNQYKDCLLFYRLGDFYEMFYDDAETGSKELDLTLTGRGCGEEDRAPMCGIPFHAVDVYIGRLVAKGYKIAICEQLEDPALAKGLVKRDVIRIITPGTVTTSELLPENRNNYLAAIATEPDRTGVCFADISTGQFYATMFTGPARFERLMSELGTYTPSEVLISGGAEELSCAGGWLTEKLGGSLSQHQASRFALSECETRVKERFPTGYTPAYDNTVITCAVGALLDYIDETQKTDLSSVSSLSVYADGQFLDIDINSRRSLELCETMRTKEKKGTLLWVLDRTRTSMGARMLRRWVEQPLISAYEIGQRQGAVDELFGDFMLREECGERLKNVLDLERLTTKLVYGSAGGKDLAAIRSTIAVIPELFGLLEAVRSDELREIRDGLSDTLEDLHSLLKASIVDSPPFSVREGGIIAKGYNEEVDQLRAIIEDSSQILNDLAERERAATGIKNLKISSNRVFGYYIEVTRSQLDLVPPHYIRKQTLAGAERYITQELKDTEATIFGASDRINTLEYELFRAVCQTLLDNMDRIRKAAALMAKLDVYLSLADVAVRQNFVRPEIGYDDVIDIRDGRHPVVEQFVADSYFVPNDTLLDTDKNRMMLITGPNMAGKSTYMRQVALIVIMAQIGSFVPAREAHIGICDRVFTRVGASDDLASGQSTFMLEMNEVAYILKHATKRSLILFDEIGRGTSTYDGMSIARAIAEYTASRRLSAKTMFATHYHELTELADVTEGVVNYNIAAKKRGDDITFLRKIVPGAADDSYGIEVAKLAGVPDAVIKRAKEILRSLEDGAAPSPKAKAAAPAEPELSFEAVIEQQLAEAVRAIDINTLTPIEALNELYRLKKLLG